MVLSIGYREKVVLSFGASILSFGRGRQLYLQLRGSEHKTRLVEEVDFLVTCALYSFCAPMLPLEMAAREWR
jgi:hypothetical protein